MGTEILAISNIEIEKKNHRNKTTNFFKNVNIEKVLISNKISFSEKSHKYFIGYLYNDHNLNSLQIMLPKASVFVKRYDGKTNWMYFWLKMMTY